MAAIVSLRDSDTSGGTYRETYFVDLNDVFTTTITPTTVPTNTGGPGQITKIRSINITPINATAATGIPGVTNFVIGGPSFTLNNNRAASATGGQYLVQLEGGI